MNATPMQPCDSPTQHGPHEWLLFGALRRECPGLLADVTPLETLTERVLTERGQQ